MASLQEERPQEPMLQANTQHTGHNAFHEVKEMAVQMVKGDKNQKEAQEQNVVHENKDIQLKSKEPKEKKEKEKGEKEKKKKNKEMKDIKTAVSADPNTVFIGDSLKDDHKVKKEKKEKKEKKKKTKSKNKDDSSSSSSSESEDEKKGGKKHK
ncbi:hypothetical protein J5N97_028121 [Dioscorea zingiberensis]|uniref:Uncharacterized protein n=1 Tax=Dioscorea zingiberensis TaxID=325984 RepID=A0A9D5BYF9_9LILI|nr:hypothetical protein J5N97_028121 [Dioscorea zingiberensis]